MLKKGDCSIVWTFITYIPLIPVLSEVPESDPLIRGCVQVESSQQDFLQNKIEGRFGIEEENKYRSRRTCRILDSSGQEEGGKLM